jgi:hypothetical protein
MVSSTGFKILYSFLYREYITHSHLLYCLLLPTPPFSALLLPLPVFHSYPSLFICLLVGQWGFCHGFIPEYVLCLSQYKPLHCTSLPFSPYLHCSTVFSMLAYCLAPTYDGFHYYLLSFFPSFTLPLVSSTSPTFGYMLCIYFYVCMYVYT